jgi:hypothetical protein
MSQEIMASFVHISTTSRPSMTSLSETEHRLAYSTAASVDFAWIIQ